MNDGILVSSSSKLENDLVTNLKRRKSSESNSDCNRLPIYSFNTFESLKDFVKLNNLVEEKPRDDLGTSLALSKIDEFTCKLRPKLSDEKIFLNRKKRRKGKPQKIIINLDNDETQAENCVEEGAITMNYNNPKTPLYAQCGREYCNYGCICDTLTNAHSKRRDHCGKIECMFECVCCTSRRASLRHISYYNHTTTGDSSDTQTTSETTRELRRSKRTRITKNFDWNSNSSLAAVAVSSAKTQTTPKLNRKSNIAREESSQLDETTSKIEKLDFSGASRTHPQHDSLILQIKQSISIPLYIESYIDWSSKSNKILKLISHVVKQLCYNDNYENWEQTELELESNLIVRLYNTYRVEKLVEQQMFKGNLRPIFIKIFKERINAAHTSLARLQKKFNTKIFIESKLSLLTRKYQFKTFIQQCQFESPTPAQVNLQTKLTINRIAQLPSPSLSSVQPHVQLTPRHDPPFERTYKSLPRLVNRKSRLRKEPQQEVHTEISDTIKRLKTYQDDNYDPFNDKSLILSLYNKYGQSLVDDVCETVNFMLKGIVLYDESLKIKAHKSQTHLKSIVTQNSMNTNIKKLTPILPKQAQFIKIQQSPSAHEHHYTPSSSSSSLTFDSTHEATNANQLKPVIKLVSVNNEPFCQQKPKTLIKISSKSVQNKKDFNDIFKTFAQASTKSTPLSNSQTPPPIVKIVNASAFNQRNKTQLSHTQMIKLVAPKFKKEREDSKNENLRSIENNLSASVVDESSIAVRKNKRKQDFTDLLKKFASTQVAIECSSVTLNKMN